MTWLNNYQTEQYTQ